MSNGQIIPVSDFAINPQSVVQVNQPNNLVVFTSTNEPNRIEKVKVTDANNVMTELVASPQGYLLQGLNTGVYTLNAIVNDDGGTKQAYETILVILAPTQQPIQPTEVIKQFFVTDVSVSFDDRKGCSNKPGSAKLQFPYQSKSECDHDEYQKCIRDGKVISLECKSWVKAFTHKCDAFKTQKECDDYYKRNPTPVPKPIPICDVNTPPGVTCRDEGDFTDCDPGFRDYGFGCEVVDEEETNFTNEDDDSNEEDTGGSDPNGEEEDQSCGGEPCTDDEKEDSWTDDEEETTDDEESNGETTEDEEEP